MKRAVTCLAALTLTVVPAFADGDPGAGEDEVYVFTNADLLARYGPPESESARTAGPAPDDAAWSFVNDYLARSYSRIDADREYEMKRRLNDAKAEELARRNSRPRYIAPYAGLYGFWARPYRYPGTDRPGIPDRPDKPGKPGGREGGVQVVGGSDGRGGAPTGGWHASPPTIRVGGSPRGWAPRHTSGGRGGGGGKH